MRDFVSKHELELPRFLEDMKTALGDPVKSGNFLYSLEDNCFTWKRSHSKGFNVKLGHIKLKKAPVIESYEILVRNFLQRVTSLREENSFWKNSSSTAKKDKDKALERLNEITLLKDEWEKKLYGRFLSVLNAKKERIQLLEEELELQEADKDEGRDNQYSDDEEDATERPAKAEKDEEEEEDDPYAGDTEEDSDGGESRRRPTSPCAPTTLTLRSQRNIFSSFDSEDGESPIRALPKRAKMSERRAQATGMAPSTSTTNTKSSAPSAGSVPQPEPEPEPEEQPSPESPQLSENTQDLLDDF